MTTSITIVGLLLVMLTAPQSQSQPSAADLVAAVHSKDARTKASAARAISDRADLHKNPAVKAAVLAELRQANEVMKLRRSTETNIASDGDFEYANVYLGLVQAAQRFDGEDVLVALIPTLGNSSSARGRVASFGPTAIAPLVAAYDQPFGLTGVASQRLALLDTLSQIVLRGEVPMPTQAKLRSLAAQALKSKEPPEVGGGMLLGAALRDAGLITEIRELRATKFRGINSTRSPNYLEAIAEKAFARAGVR